MARRRLLAGSVASVALIAGGTTVAARLVGADDSPAEPEEEQGPENTAEVAVRDLEESTELDGTLGYSDLHSVSLMEGTVTALPESGTTLERGDMVAEVDGHKVPLFIGERPFWRPLQATEGEGQDATALADGPDVEQLEANLVALGYATEAELTVDEEWTDATTAAVKEWQEDLGVEEDGVVSPNDAVVLPESVRVASHSVEVGDPAQGPVLEVSEVDRQVTVDLETTDLGLLEVDQTVDVVLPDGSAVPGTVTSVSDTAEDPSADEGDGGEGGGGGGGGDEEDTTPTREVVIALDASDEANAEAIATFDQAPVTVEVVTPKAEQVPTVPVEALLALAEGGHAVERVGEDGTTELVVVDTEAFADGWVEISGEAIDNGELAEGDVVVVPT